MLRVLRGAEELSSQHDLSRVLSSCQSPTGTRCRGSASTPLASLAGNTPRTHAPALPEATLTREDPDSVGEQCFVTLGLSSFGNLLVVVYAYREPNVIRLISAWKANKRQRLSYEKNRR